MRGSGGNVAADEQGATPSVGMLRRRSSVLGFNVSDDDEKRRKPFAHQQLSEQQKQQQQQQNFANIERRCKCITITSARLTVLIF